MTDQTSALILYLTEDGRIRIECRFEDDTLWLTQIQPAELFQASVPNLNIHRKAICDEAELASEATIKSRLIVQSEVASEASRPVLHYALPAILAVGLRVRSHGGERQRRNVLATRRRGREEQLPFSGHHATFAARR
jgi:hypothetical protein